MIARTSASTTQFRLQITVGFFLGMTHSTARRGRRSYTLDVHRRALGLLFSVLATGLAAIAVLSALEGGRAWVIALAAGALGTWMGSLALRALRRA